MIGQLRKDGVIIAILNDDGVWAADDPELSAVAKVLNAIESPDDNWDVGDHHVPFGVASLRRAARKLKANVELAQPIKPLPEGYVS